MYVVSSFVADEKPADVYNLTVDAAHEFFAGGVLVHNCDALRYLAINLGAGPSFPILDPIDEPIAGSEVLQPLGAFAVRTNHDSAAWWDEPGHPGGW